MKILYKDYLKKYSRSLRNNATHSEKILWRYLKGKQIKGYLFSRQKPFGKYIVDFYCFKLKLVIEVDGISHLGNEIKDLEKQNYIESVGFTVLRFNDAEVQLKISNVISKINDWITKNESKQNNPLTH